MASTQERREIIADHALQWLQHHGTAAARRLSGSNDLELIVATLADACKLLHLYPLLPDQTKQGRHDTYLRHARLQVRWQAGQQEITTGHLVAARALRHANNSLARKSTRPQ